MLEYEVVRDLNQLEKFNSLFFEIKYMLLIPTLLKVMREKYGSNLTEEQAYEKILNMDFPHRPIMSPEDVVNLPLRLRPRDVRISRGLYKTEEEYEEWREKVLSTPLP